MRFLFFCHVLVAVVICESPPVIKRAVLPKAAIYHFCQWFLYPWGVCTMKYVAVRKSSYLMQQENQGRRENLPHFSLLNANKSDYVFLTKRWWKKEHWKQSSRAILTQTQITCLRKRTSEHVTCKRIVLHSDVRCVLRCVPEWTQPQTCGTTHGENGLCLKQDGVLVSQLFLASIGKECPAQYLVLTVPMQHCATNGVQTTKTKRLKTTKRYVSRFRVIGKMHI